MDAIEMTIFVDRKSGAAAWKVDENAYVGDVAMDGMSVCFSDALRMAKAQIMAALSRVNLLDDPMIKAEARDVIRDLGIQNDSGTWNKIALIKELKDRTACGLLEAKNAIDAELSNPKPMHRNGAETLGYILADAIKSRED